MPALTCRNASQLIAVIACCACALSQAGRAEKAPGVLNTNQMQFLGSSFPLPSGASVAFSTGKEIANPNRSWIAVQGNRDTQTIEFFAYFEELGRELTVLRDGRLIRVDYSGAERPPEFIFAEFTRYWNADIELKDKPAHSWGIGTRIYDSNPLLISITHDQRIAPLQTTVVYFCNMPHMDDSAAADDLALLPYVKNSFLIRAVVAELRLVATESKEVEEDLLLGTAEAALRAAGFTFPAELGTLDNPLLGIRGGAIR